MKSKAVISICLLVACLCSYGCKTLTYDGNGATSGTVPAEPAKYRKGANIEVLGNTGSLAKTGFSFSGWNTAADGSGTEYAAGDTFKMGNKNSTLFAAWAEDITPPPTTTTTTMPATYSVTYDDNNSTGGSAPIDPNQYVAGATVTVLGNTDNMTKTGFNFSGWNTAADGSGTSYAAGATLTMGSADVLLHAKWLGRWTRLQGRPDNETSVSGIGVDAGGNSYVAGYIYDDDSFITKYSPAGTAQWTSWLSSPGTGIESYDIAVDAEGNSYVTGRTNIDLDGQQRTGGTDAFIMKFNSSGSKQWTRLLGALGNFTGPAGIAVDASGSSYVTGMTTGALEGAAPQGIYDLFIAKFNASGELIWVHQIGGEPVTSYTVGNDIAVDENGNSYVTGYIQGTSLDGITLNGNKDAFVIKYSSAGDRQWTSLIGTSGAACNAGIDNVTEGNGIAVMPDGTSYATGYTFCDLFGEAFSGGDRDLFLVKHDASGNRQWTRMLGQATYATDGKDVAVDAAGNAYVAGYTDATYDAGAPYLAIFSALALKYSPAGTKLWARQSGSKWTSTLGAGIAMDANGTCYVTGQTNTNLDNETRIGTRDLFITTQLNP